MKLTLESIRDAFRSYYDRVFAFIAILILLGSLVMLLMRLGAIKADEQRFTSWKEGLTPAFANATNVTLDLFVQGHASLTNPFQITAWSRSLSVPEMRVACVACMRPIPHDAAVCVHCGFKPEERPVPRDKDEDGMDDEWETGQGLNPLDPDDAKGDLDKDGFTNLEEFRAVTDPKDPESHPSILDKIVVSEIKAIPFHLKFMAVTRFTEGVQYQINNVLIDKTDWYKMGDEVDGYILKDYKENKVQVSKNKEEDRSTLTLVNKVTGRAISLQILQDVPPSEYEVRMVLEVDRLDDRVKPGGEFTVRGTVYTVKEIDNKDSRVLIVDKNSGKETWIGRQAEVVAPPQP